MEEMKKERQRWSAEEDALLSSYVNQYGPREWHLVSQRMNTPLLRDAKSCLERWKNYLKPGIKKGSLTEEEQRLVIRLQAKHGNKWKKIAAEVPGRTAKRLGKWWEVYKEKQQRDLNKKLVVNNSSKVGVVDPIEERKYDTILGNFAEKLVKERSVSTVSGGSVVGTGAGGVAVVPTYLMPSTATSNCVGGVSAGFLHSESSVPVPRHCLPSPQLLPVMTSTHMLPPWLSSISDVPTSSIPAGSCCGPSSPSVTLSLASSTIPLASAIPWLHQQQQSDPRAPSDHHQHLHHHHHHHHHQNNSPLSLNSLPPLSSIQMQQSNSINCGVSNPVMMTTIPDLIDCCRELEEGHRAWAAHKKEASWRLQRVELQLDAEKACRRKEKMDEIEAKMKALREEQKIALERIEAEYREQLAGLRRDAEAKEQKLAEQWAAKHLRLAKFLEQMGCRSHHGS